MSVDWVRVYQDPDHIDYGCDTDDWPTADYINKHKEAYTNSNFTVWGYTREDGGYPAQWPKNRLYTKGCDTKADRSRPGDPDRMRKIAPVIQSDAVTSGVGNDKTITNSVPHPGAPGSTPTISAKN